MSKPSIKAIPAIASFAPGEVVMPIAEAARLTGVHAGWLRRAVDDGTIAAARVGGALCVAIADVRVAVRSG